MDSTSVQVSKKKELRMVKIHKTEQKIKNYGWKLAETIANREKKFKVNSDIEKN